MIGWRLNGVTGKMAQLFLFSLFLLLFFNLLGEGYFAIHRSSSLKTSESQTLILGMEEGPFMQLYMIESRWLIELSV